MKRSFGKKLKGINRNKKRHNNFLHTYLCHSGPCHNKW